MSSSDLQSMAALSGQLVALVQNSTQGVAAVKGAPYRMSSAVALAPDLLATTDHTLKREERIGIVLPTGEQTAASLIGRAPGIDVAFLKLESASLTPLKEGAPARVGSLISVVGYTSDVGASASLGIIGAVGAQRRTWRGGTLDQFLRLDVNLYPSQCGAAVVDVDGGLIGLATPALMRHSAVAVPYATLHRIAGELLREGRLRQGYLGVGLQPVALPENLRQRHGLSSSSGLMLLSIESGSPAENSGLQLGDILVGLGSVTISEPEDLQEALRGDAVGQTREAVLLRAGELVRLPVYIQERRSQKAKE